MKNSPSYQSLFTIAAICLGINILVAIGVLGFVLKAVGIIALIWGIIVFFKGGKETKTKAKK